MTIPVEPGKRENRCRPAGTVRSDSDNILENPAGLQVLEEERRNGKTGTAWAKFVQHLRALEFRFSVYFQPSLVFSILCDKHVAARSQLHTCYLLSATWSLRKQTAPAIPGPSFHSWNVPRQDTNRYNAVSQTASGLPPLRERVAVAIGNGQLCVVRPGQEEPARPCPGAGLPEPAALTTSGYPCRGGLNSECSEAGVNHRSNNIGGLNRRCELE